MINSNYPQHSKQMIKPILKTKGNEVYFAHDNCKFYILSDYSIKEKSSQTSQMIEEDTSNQNNENFEELVDNICYDENRDCFWGCSQKANNIIYSLNKHTTVTGRIINTNHKNCYKKPNGICHNAFTDTIMLAYDNEIIILSDKGNFITSLKINDKITDISCCFSFIFILSKDKIIAIKYNGYKLWEQKIEFDDEFLCLQVNDNYFDKSDFSILGKKALYNLRMYHI